MTAVWRKSEHEGELSGKAHKGAFPRISALRRDDVAARHKRIEAAPDARCASKHGFDNNQMCGAHQPHHLQDRLASNLPGNRHVRAELHGLVGHFTTAGANGNGRNQSSKNDSFLHLKSPKKPSKACPNC